MINTVLLIADVLTARMYFNAESTGEAELREIADQTVSACRLTLGAPEQVSPVTDCVLHRRVHRRLAVGDLL